MKKPSLKIQSLVVAALALATVALASPIQEGQGQSCCTPMQATQTESAKQAGTNAKLVKGVQKATVNIFGGYKPGVIYVKKGKPVELTFTRTERNGCGNVLVIDALKVRREIGPGRSTVVKFTPNKAGEIPFECGMKMIRGKVVVQ